jgi:hypothetical protein
MKKASSKRQTAKPVKEKQPDAKQIDPNKLPNKGDGTDEGNNEFRDEFREAQKFARGNSLYKRKVREEVNSDVEPSLAGDDPDAFWMEAGTSGDESVVGGNTSPDQNDVDTIGEAVGLPYEDNEPLHTTEKIEERDRHRWELDPASSEDYKIRVKRQGG